MSTNHPTSDDAALFPCSRPPYGKKIVHHSFKSFLLGELFVHKLAGFADHFDARICEVSEQYVRMQVGSRGLLGWKDCSSQFPVDLRVNFQPTFHESGVCEVDVVMRPIAVGVPRRFYQDRYEAILRELHAYLIPQLMSCTPRQRAG